MELLPTIWAKVSGQRVVIHLVHAQTPEGGQRLHVFHRRLLSRCLFEHLCPEEEESCFDEKQKNFHCIPRVSRIANFPSPFL